MSSDCLETSDTFFPRLTLVLQLAVFPALHCLPWCFLFCCAQACSRLNTNICKLWWKFLFCWCKSCWTSRAPPSLCHVAATTAYFTAEIQQRAAFRCEMHINDSHIRLYHHSFPSLLRVWFKRFLPPFCRCWISCAPTCAQRCSGSGGSLMWTVSTCTTFLIASSTGCSGVTARACGAASPTAGRPGQSQTGVGFQLVSFHCKKENTVDVFMTT